MFHILQQNEFIWYVIIDFFLISFAATTLFACEKTNFRPSDEWLLVL